MITTIKPNHAKGFFISFITFFTPTLLLLVILLIVGLLVDLTVFLIAADALGMSVNLWSVYLLLCLLGAGIVLGGVFTQLILHLGLYVDVGPKGIEFVHGSRKSIAFEKVNSISYTSKGLLKVFGVGSIHIITTDENKLEIPYVDEPELVVHDLLLQKRLSEEKSSIRRARF